MQNEFKKMYELAKKIEKDHKEVKSKQLEKEKKFNE
jgi:hypothetical protein